MQIILTGAWLCVPHFKTINLNKQGQETISFICLYPLENMNPCTKFHSNFSALVEVLQAATYTEKLQYNFRTETEQSPVTYWQLWKEIFLSAKIPSTTSSTVYMCFSMRSHEVLHCSTAHGFQTTSCCVWCTFVFKSCSECMFKMREKRICGDSSYVRDVFQNQSGF